MVLFYIVHKIIATKVAYFSKVCYHPSFKDSKLEAVSVAFISDICACTVLLLFAVRNLKYDIGVTRNNINFLPDFVLISRFVLKSKLQLDVSFRQMVILSTVSRRRKEAKIEIPYVNTHV
jgi:hypothetical protein